MDLFYGAMLFFSNRIDNLENPKLLLSSEDFFFEDIDHKNIPTKDEDHSFSKVQDSN